MHVSASFSLEGASITGGKVRYSTGDFPVQRERVRDEADSVHHCLVHNTLLTQPEIKIELTVGHAALQQG
jgi:hypothetical protein